jgi:hypothetical protein
VMPHPILKKTRGPSIAGPRPTARFISPHDSEVEADSPLSPNEHVVVEPPSPDSQTPKTDKKSSSSGSGKKQGYVASAGSKKKRPVIVRRKSSQSSNDSMSKTTESQADILPSSAGKTPPPDSSQRGKSSSQSKMQEHQSSTPEKSPKKRCSSKPSDSRKSTSRKSTSGNRREEGQSSRAGPSSNGDPGPSTLRNVENQQPDLTEEKLEELEVQRILLAEANARVQAVPQAPAQAIRESTRNLSSGRQLQAANRSASEGNLGKTANRFMSPDYKSNASLAPTLSDATGELDMREEGSGTPEYTGKGKERAAGEPHRSIDIFAKRPVPPISATSSTPADTPVGSLARSKSQLTLLLQKDKERSKDHKPNDDKKKAKKG